MNWTDLSANGTSSAVRITDAEGNFSIENIRGKNFGITALERAGYQAARATNRASFEYAGFWEPTYHELDAKHPVILKIRKKGEAAALLSVRGKTIVNFGTAVWLPMPGDSNGKFPIKVSVTESDAKGRRWKAQISVEGGGILPALAEFPVEAPKDGLSICHFPPGTSKWNKIKHRLFSFISSNWRGEPQRDYETVVNLIAKTTTAKGLKVTRRLDRR